MKLLTLTNRFHLISNVLILSLGGVVGYYILKNIINHEFNEKLFADKEQFLFEWHAYDDIEQVFYLNIGDKIEVKPLSKEIRIEPVLIDTIKWDDYEKKELPFRQLMFSDRLNGKNYSITITKSLLPTEDLVRGVGEIILLLMFFIVLSLVVINRQISKTIWSPFYDTISKLGYFKLTAPIDLQFIDTNIFEFKRLNEGIQNMLKKSQKDYLNLKEFTENASHEIQTPLAIIKSKAELLLQGGNLSQSDFEEIIKINEAASRLSKLKTGLSMLAKMDNNQFEEVEAIELVPFIDKKLTYFEELIELKGIKLTKKYNAEPTLVLNNTLAYILISNLMNNAIKHNLPNGELNITVNQNGLVFENSGQPLDGDPELFFQRFKKGSGSHDSSGLGLALIKKVCDIYKMAIRYTVNGSVHKITIRF